MQETWATLTVVTTTNSIPADILLNFMILRTVAKVWATSIAPVIWDTICMPPIVVVYQYSPHVANVARHRGILMSSLRSAGRTTKPRVGETPAYVSRHLCVKPWYLQMMKRFTELRVVWMKKLMYTSVRAESGVIRQLAKPAQRTVYGSAYGGRETQRSQI